jgi:hypothetical protein
MERGPLSLVSTTEELLGSNSSGSGLESREYGRRICHVDHVAPSIRKKLALTSLTSGGRSVGIVHLRTEAMDFFYRSCIVSSSRYSCHPVSFEQQYLAERNSLTDHCFGQNGISCRRALHHVTSAGEEYGSPWLQCDR